MNNELIIKGKKAKEASYTLSFASTNEKNNGLLKISESLIKRCDEILEENKKDLEKAIEKGVKFSGCTVHFVNDEVDGGAIIDQEIVPVKYEDKAEDLQKRILEKEHILLHRVVKLLSEGKIKLVDNKVKIEG